MHRLLSAGAAICAAATLTIPATAGATTTTPTAAKPKPAAVSFTPVKVAITPEHVASIEDGTAYVSGHDKNGKVTVIRVTRTRHGVSTETVRIPAGLTKALKLYASGKHVYGFAGGYGIDPALIDIVGRHATKLTVPVMKNPQGYPVYPTAFAVDRPGSLWLSANGPGPGSYSHHGDGHTWTQLPQASEDTAETIRSYATQGHLFEIRALAFAPGLPLISQEWTGTTWANPARLGMDALGNTHYESIWTLAGPADYTRWGYASAKDIYGKQPPVNMHGTCTHVVNGSTKDCPAPAWGISAAARLGDGGVVLGGFDGQGRGDAVVNGGFAYVPQPGAKPIAIGGDNGKAVEEIATPAQGYTTWAITSTGGREWNAHGFTGEVKDKALTLQVATPPRHGRC